MSMQKRTAPALIISIILLSLVAGMQAVEVANANFLPTEKPTNPPPITIYSPLNITYNQNDILLNFTIVGISRWWTIAYHLTNLYYEIDGKSVSLYANSSTNTEQHSTSIIGLAKGQHTLTVHANASGLYSNNPNPPEQYSIESTQTASFTIDKELEIISSLPSPSLTISPSPKSHPTLTLSLSESASALYYGNTVNFTVLADGGTKPYTYAWHIDGQMAQTSASQYFSTDSQAVGSHHVYVQVTDADNNSATTLTVEFNVLQVSVSSPSSFPTQQPTTSPSTDPTSTPDSNQNQTFPQALIYGTFVLAVVLTATAVAIVLLIKRRRLNK
jgi:hypothetical protein